MVKPNLNDIKALIEQAEKLKRKVEELKKKSFLTEEQSKAISDRKRGIDIALYLLRLSYTNREECENNFGIVDSYFTLTGSLKSGQFAQNLGDRYTDYCGEKPERIEWYDPNKHKGLFVRYDFDEKKFWRSLNQYTTKQRQLYWENHIQPLIIQLDTDLTPWLPFMKPYIDTEKIQEAIKTAKPATLSDAIYEFKKIQKVVEAEGRQETAETEAENVFKKNGDFWEVRFDSKPSKPVPIKDSKGMTYIAKLLASDKPISVMALTLEKVDADLLNKGTNLATDDPDDGNLGDGLTTLVAEGLADKEALQAAHRRLKEIPAEIDEAKNNCDDAEVARLEKEKDGIQEYLNQTLRPGSYTVKTFQTGAKKIADKVRKAIDRAIDSIQEKKELNSLGTHLKQTILQNGVDFSYKPDRKMNWEL